MKRNLKILNEEEFCLEIAFKKDSDTPIKIFRTLSSVIDSFQKFDGELIQTISTDIKPIILLEDIEIGSIKTLFKYVLTKTDDEDLKNLNWKRIIGTFLVEAKYYVLNSTKNKTQIQDKSEIKQLQNDIVKLAEITNLKQLPYYKPIDEKKLMENIHRIHCSVMELTNDEKLIYKIKDKETFINFNFKIDSEIIENLITKEIIKNQQEIILKIKKPDFIGSSQWDFIYNEKTIPVKITDLNWLNLFQKRLIELKPGDSVRAKVNISVNYGFNFEVISTHYEIIEVIEIISNKTDINDQGVLL